jgi:hypothetical protein
MRRLHSFAPIRWVREEACPEERFQRSIDSNNPLAVELKRENDRVSRRFFRQTYLPALSVISPHLDRRLQCDSDEDFFDVQNVVA